jgi:cell division septation protein DedD
MKSREFREIQVSSTQLAVIFLGILAIGVVIFLLGVSVGKKQIQAAQKANVIASREPEQIKEKMVSLPQVKPDREPAAEAAEKQAPAQTEANPVKMSFIPKKPEAKTQVEAKPEEPAAPAGSGREVTTETKNLFYVQVGALAEKQAAQETAQRFRKLGYPVVVMDPQATDKKPVFRVRIGGFITKEQAEEARARLSSAAGKKTDFFIVRD